MNQNGKNVHRSNNQNINNNRRNLADIQFLQNYGIQLPPPSTIREGKLQPSSSPASLSSSAVRRDWSYILCKHKINLCKNNNLTRMLVGSKDHELQKLNTKIYGTHYIFNFKMV